MGKKKKCITGAKQQCAITHVKTSAPHAGSHFSTESRDSCRFRCKSHLAPGVHVSFMKTCTSGQLQHTNEQVSINVRAGDSHHFNNTPPFSHGLASLASRLDNTEEREIAKKRNLSETKTKKR